MNWWEYIIIAFVCVVGITLVAWINVWLPYLSERRADKKHIKYIERIKNGEKP